MVGTGKGEGTKIIKMETVHHSTTDMDECIEEVRKPNKQQQIDGGNRSSFHTYGFIKYCILIPSPSRVIFKMSLDSPRRHFRLLQYIAMQIFKLIICPQSFLL